MECIKSTWEVYDRNTPKITINNMTLGQARKAVTYESGWLKVIKVAIGILLGIVSVVVCSYFLARRGNVRDIQDHCADLAPQDYTYLCNNSTLYDWGFRNGPFTNETDAEEYERLLGNCDLECQTIGNRWSIVYTLCGFSMLLFVIQAVFVTLGVFLYPFRLIGLTFQACFCLVNFGAVLTTSVFRFNTMGKLAALSEAPSAYGMVDGVPSVTMDRTYVDDGQLILDLFVLSLLFFIAQCCLACFALAPPSQDKLRKMGIDFNEQLNEEGQRIMQASL